MRLILFDIDGTLVWTRGAGRASLAGTLEMLFEQSHSALAGRIRAKIAAHSFGGKTDWLTLHELLDDEGFAKDEIAGHMPRFTALMGESLARVVTDYDVQPCTGAVEVVRQLRGRDDVLLGLVTGNVHTTAPIKLAAAGFDPADFPIGGYGDDAVERDDLPILALRRAEEHYGRRIMPEQVIVVGDTLSDIQAARTLPGCKIVSVLTGFGKRDELEAAHPDYLLDDLTTFVELVISPK